MNRMRSPVTALQAQRTRLCGQFCARFPRQTRIRAKGAKSNDAANRTRPPCKRPHDLVLNEHRGAPFCHLFKELATALFSSRNRGFPNPIEGHADNEITQRAALRIFTGDHRARATCDYNGAGDCSRGSHRYGAKAAGAPDRRPGEHRRHQRRGAAGTGTQLHTGHRLCGARHGYPRGWTWIASRSSKDLKVRSTARVP